MRWETSRRIFAVRGETDTKAANIQARLCMARTLDEIGKKCSVLDNARKLRGIYFIDPEDKEFKETIKNAPKKLETPVSGSRYALQHEQEQSEFGWLVVNPMISNQNLCVFWKPVNLQDCVWENLYRIIMNTMLQEKGTIHCSITIWHTNVFLCPKPWKFLQQRQQWTRNGTNWKRFRQGTWRKSEVRSDRWSKDERRRSSFSLADGHSSLIESWIGDKAPKIQRSSCTPRWYCERWFWILCSIHWTRFISITNGSSKSHGYHLQIARVRRTSSWRSICLYPQVGMEDALKLLKIPKSECPDIWIRLPRHKWPKIWSRMEDPVVRLERHLYGHPLAGLLWERQLEKILLKYGWEKVSNWECFIVHREKGLFLSVIDPMWKVLNEEVDLEEPTSFFDHVYQGCTQRQCEISKDIVPCLNPEFPQGELNNYHSRKIWVFLRGLMIWKVMPRNVWKDIVSQQTRRLNNSTKYQLHALMTIISQKKNWNL